MQISNCEAVSVWSCSDMYDYCGKLGKKLHGGSVWNWKLDLEGCFSENCKTTPTQGLKINTRMPHVWYRNTFIWNNKGHLRPSPWHRDSRFASPGIWKWKFVFLEEWWRHISIWMYSQFCALMNLAWPLVCLLLCRCCTWCVMCLIFGLFSHQFLELFARGNTSWVLHTAGTWKSTDRNVVFGGSFRHYVQLWNRYDWNYQWFHWRCTVVGNMKPFQISVKNTETPLLFHQCSESTLRCSVGLGQ